MPVYHLTFRAYGTWLPDHPKGWCSRKLGWQAPREILGEQFRRRMVQKQQRFTYAQQRVVIKELADACARRDCRLLAAVGTASHFHLVVAWDDESRSWSTIAAKLKGALTRLLNDRFGKRKWFGKKCGHRRLSRQEHLDYLVNAYLPGHRGWLWTERDGLSLRR